MRKSDVSVQVAVVVVNWNGWQDTLEAHASLEKSTLTDWHLIVVENGSTDGSADHLRNLPQTTLIETGRNAGFAGGCNIGIARALEIGAASVFLLNNDAAVRPDTLSRLVETSAQTGDAVLGCLVKLAGLDHIQFFGAKTGDDAYPRWFRDPQDGAHLEQALIKTDFIFGAALFAPAEVFRRVGLFDERFFLTYEETDFCYRARDAGFPCLVVRDAVVDHQSGKTLGDWQSPLQAYFLTRNGLLFLEKHAGIRRLINGFKMAIDSIRYAGAKETRRARLIGLRDYVFRRFGNCPDAVRG